MANTLSLPNSGRLEININLSAEVHMTATTARRKVNAFLASNVGNLLLADDPVLTIAERIVWRVPVDLTAPETGRIGRVGEVDVDVESGDLLIDEQQIATLKHNAFRLAERTPP